MKPSPLTELMLFNASRSQLVSEVIKPSLKMGKVTLCDRYVDSTVAYQSYGRGLDRDLVNSVNDIAIQGTKPDLTILLNITAEEGIARKYSVKKDRFERENIAFHHRVHDGYLTLAAEEPERWLVIKANQSKKRIASIIWRRTIKLLEIKGIRPADG
jgi:dTMP kinase